jgi:hypothetical protein
MDGGDGNSNRESAGGDGVVLGSAPARDPRRSALLLLPDGVTPAAHVAVTMFDPAHPGRNRERHVTDAEGRFFPWPDSALRWAVAHVPGTGFAIAGQSSESESESGASAARRVVCAPGTALRGTVTDAHGNALAGARVALAFEEPLRPFRAESTSDDAGRFEFGGLPCGTARVAAIAFLDADRAAEEATARRVFLAPSRVAEIALVAGLRPAGRAGKRPRASDTPPPPPPLAADRAPVSALWTVSGVAIDETGSPVPGVRVALDNEANGVWAETVTDAAGRFVFRTAPLDGPTRIEALGAAFDGVVEDAAFEPGSAIVLPLERLGAIRGRIGGAPPLAPGETVTLLVLSTAADSAPIVLERAPGEFLAAGLRPGRYAVSLIARGRVVWHADAVGLEPGGEIDLGRLDPRDVPDAWDRENERPTAEAGPSRTDWE